MDRWTALSICPPVHLPFCPSVHLAVMTTLSRKPETDVSTLVQRAAAILLDHKANDVVLLSLKGVSDMTDYFLIASGTSDTHVRSLGQSVLEDMKKETGQTAHHVEGLEQGRW